MPAAPNSSTSGSGRWRRLIFFALLLLTSSLRADTALSGRLVSVPFDSEYLVDRFGVEEGFPGNSCTGIGQTPDGYLWFSSFSGLARFNGVDLSVVAAENEPQVPDSRVANCYVDHQGRLLASTLHGLAIKIGNNWTNFSESKIWGERELVRNYAEGTNHEFFVTTTLGRVFQVTGNQLQPLPGVPGKGGAYCGVDVNGQPFVVRGDFVGFWNGTQWVNFSGVENVVGQTIGLGQARNGGIWLVLTNRVLLVRQGQVQQERKLTENVDGFWQLLEDSRGNLWLPSIQRGLWRVATNGAVKLFDRSEGLPNSAGTRAVFEDAQGSLWIGCAAGGVVRFRPARFHTLNSRQGLPELAATAIASTTNGNLLIGIYGSGLVRFDGRRVTPLSQPDSKFIQSLVCTRRGEIFIGTAQDGLLQMVDGAVRSLNQQSPLIPANVSSLFEDSQGRLWIGNINSVGFLTNGSYQPLPRPPEWQLESVLFAEQPDQTILIANQNHLFAVSPGADSLKRQLVLPKNTRISSLLVDSQNRIWIGTAKSGLFVLGQGHLFKLRANPGWPGDNINGLIEDTSGQIWFGSGRSIVTARSDDLWRAASTTNLELTLKKFNQHDGIGPVDFPEGFQNVSHRDAAGRLWFGLLRGVTMVEPQQLRYQTAPDRLTLESLDYFHAGSNQPVKVNLQNLGETVVLPADSRQIQIHCALLDYAAPEKNRYYFLLDEPNLEWRNNGAGNIISFYQLTAGTHRLLVRAAGSDGTISEVRTFEFRVEENFWRTTWFWVLCSSLIVLITGAATWWLTHQRVVQARERLTQERRLAELQARLGSVLENTSDFVGFADAQGKMFFLNHAGRKLIGLTDDAPLADVTMENLYPAWVRQLHEPLWQPGTQKVWTGESALRHRDGREIPISQVIITHRNAAGALDFTSTISRDISATKQNERIREALRHLASALTAALKLGEIGRTVALECQKVFQHDAFFFVMLDRNGKIAPGGYREDTPAGAAKPVASTSTVEFISPTLQSVIVGKELLLNRAPAELAGKQPLGRFGEVNRPSASLMYAPITWEGQTIGMMSVQSYTPNRYKKTDDLKLLRSFADQCGPVVARLLVEDKLRQNEERLRLAMDAARIGSWEIRLADTRLVASEQAEKIYGYPPGTMHGDIRCLTEKIPPAEADAMRRQFVRLLATEVPAIECVHRWLAPDGTEKWLEVKGQIRHGDVPGQSRALGITADITERRQAELEKERLESQLRQAQKLDALGRLAGGIAHDFNNILTSIMGFNEMALLDLPPGHAVTANLREVAQGTLRAKQLVSQILAFSSRREQPRANVELWPIVKEAINLLRSSLPANIEIRSESAAEGKDFILAEPSQIHQVIMNLGTNAAHALRDHGGVLDIRAEALEFSAPWQSGVRRLPAGKYVRLTVADTGIGMTPEVLERIFEPFFSTKVATEGTGLGLSVVHGILKNHDAEISVTSEPGKGTVFEITFPAVAAVAKPENTVAPAPRNADGKHILLVDDEERIVRLATRILQRQGHRVTSFTSPDAALAAFQKSPDEFHTLLTDLTMPGMNGLELAKQIHALRPALPVVLCSGYANLASRENFEAAGIRFLVEKPYNVEELAQMVARALKPAA